MNHKTEIFLNQTKRILAEELSEKSPDDAIAFLEGLIEWATEQSDQLIYAGELDIEIED